MSARALAGARAWRLGARRTTSSLPALPCAFGLLSLVIWLSADVQAKTLSGYGLFAEVDKQHPDGQRVAPHGASAVAAIENGRAAGLASLRSLTAPGKAGVPFEDPPHVAVPHITLRTNDGQYFGGSLAAVGDLLVLGWGDRALASPDAADGGMFYLSFEKMWGDAPENDGKVVRVFASEVGTHPLSCIETPAALRLCVGVWCLYVTLNFGTGAVAGYGMLSIRQPVGMCPS